LDQPLYNPNWLGIVRAVHFASAILLLAIWIFDRFYTPVEIRGKIYHRSMLVLVPLNLLSGFAWFALVTIAMSGVALQMSTMKIVWSQTQFGHAWQVHTCAWATGTIVWIIYLYVRPRFLKNILGWTALALAAVYVASLAWTGHGSDGNYPAIHLTADVTHLLVAAAWPGGLYPLSILLWRLRKSGDLLAVNRLVYRFSAASLVAVCLMAATGVANTCFLVNGYSDLYQTKWGRILIWKVSLFLVVVSIGAVNLLRLKPRLATSSRALQRNVTLELALATGIILLVGLLGMQAP
jgi:copper resistance protein D